jgi:hypothetical protein
MTDKERFMAKVVKDTYDPQCWLWRAGKFSNGYGAFRHGGTRYAHRASWLLFRGPITDGMAVLHSCDNRACVNPDHLWIGTYQDNLSDMARKGRAHRSPNGLPFGVSMHKKRKKPFAANVCHRYKVHFLGYYATAEEAASVAADFKNNLYAVTQ